MIDPKTGKTIIDPKTGEEWSPAFPAQRPPFQPGNELTPPGNTRALTHGAFSPRMLEPIANGIRERILADDDVWFLRLPRFEDALEAYAMTAARVVRLEAWVAEMGDAEAARSDRGQTSPLELLRKWKVTADNERARLGLDAVSWAKIRKDFATGTQINAALILTQRRAEAEGREAS